MRPRKDSTTIFELTPTTICCGIVSVKLGVQLVCFFTIVEGACQLYVYLTDVLSGEPVFRWGPSRYERHLQFTSGLMGAAAVLFGLLGIWSTRTCGAGVVRGLRRFQAGMLLWTVLWFLLVGLPVKVEYVSVPSVETWPLSRLPGLPMRSLVDPEWPNGKPAVCQDIADIKGRLVKSLNSKQKRRWLRRLLSRVYTKVFKRVLTCQQTVKVFWGWCAAALALKAYGIWVTGYFLKVVLHGGDGVMMMGRLSDLDKPVPEKSTTMMLLREHVRSAFEQIDTDGDGRLSLEELLHFLEGTNHRFKGIAETCTGKGVDGQLEGGSKASAS